MRLEKIISRGRIVDLRSLDLEGALQELLAVCVDKFPDLKPDALLRGLLAREGTMFTNFHVAQPVCSAGAASAPEGEERHLLLHVRRSVPC